MNFDWHILIVVLIFIVLDVLTGVMQAFKNKKLDSSIMRDGLYHKSAFLFAIMFAYACEYGMIYLDLGFELPIVSAVCVYICLTEVISILENLSKLNPVLANSKFMQLFASSKELPNAEGNRHIEPSEEYQSPGGTA